MFVSSIMVFELPHLKYEYCALEPYIDALTMEVHHTKHHRAYTDKFNVALEKHPELFEKSADEIISELNNVPEDIREAVRNNGGGYVNHKMFWEILGKEEFGGKLKVDIDETFGSFDNFKKEFSEKAMAVFGSGWAWLVVDKGKLKIVSTSNQDSPLSSGMKPILCLDVWEHAYYLKYQNKRMNYIGAFWNVVNWDKVEEFYNLAVKN